jgi:hypothetical protein
MEPIKLHIEMAQYNIEQAYKLINSVDENMHEYIMEIILHYVQKCKEQLDMVNLYMDKEHK